MPNKKDGDWKDDSLTGTSDDDSISGKSGDDTIDGGAGNDTLSGDSGEDQLFGGEGDDSLDGGSQKDTLSGGAGNDTLKGGSEDDVLSGGDGDDYLEGGSQSDSLFGGAGNDTLFGGSDSDYIDGGAGDDLILEGGYEGGQDTIVFGADSGNDTVDGFSPADDKIYIRGASLDDVILTPTDDPKIWVLTLKGVADSSLTINFQYYWDSGISVEELTEQVITEEDDGPMPTDPYPSPICLTEGTMVDTPQGPRAVETLKPGDLVLTYDAGAQPLRAVLRNRVPVEALAEHATLRPVAIAASAFGEGLPRRPMQVSLQHAFLAWDGRPNGKGEVLVRARHIAEEIGCATLVELVDAPVSYIHLLMDRHHLVRAEGVWTETVFTGEEALAADPVLQRMISGGHMPAIKKRVRRLLLRKHLQRFNGHALGVGDPDKRVRAA
ncbi:Hint domain-containing protein [Pseudoruegeria sp. HB172150]|uniref:Hint domain-containing protein n=1 Tax=Pseudoruegeria sp. HB172150 TaxID=2721164 RepID=UPI001553EE47|nr:Hint domain-containing protein [Pseudoruegeria sp. HB172150]